MNVLVPDPRTDLGPPTLPEVARRAAAGPASVTARRPGETDAEHRTRAVLIAVRPLRHPLYPDAPFIGERICKNCKSTLFEHCEVHGNPGGLPVPPCCPGQCPGLPRERRRHRRPWQI